MRIESAVLAEGVAPDIRGAMTLVGFNQRVVAAPRLPFAFNQTLVLTLVSDDEVYEESNVSALLTVQFTSPSGVIGFSGTQPIPLVERKVPTLPAFANIALEMPLVGDAYGTYLLKVSLREPKGTEAVLEIPFYVLSLDQMSKVPMVVGSQLVSDA